MVLTLYKLDASPPVRSVLMVIESLGLTDVELVDVDVLGGAHLKEDFTKMNPQHTIPLLQDDDFFVWDRTCNVLANLLMRSDIPHVFRRWLEALTDGYSHAIAVYLVSKYGSDDALYPADPQRRALIDQRLHFDSGILFPALRNTVAPIFFGGEKAPRPENLENIKKAYDFSEKFLTNSWMVGNNITLADICCVSTLSSMNEVLPIDAALFPKLSAWLDKCSQEEFCKKGNKPGLAMFRGLVKSKLG